ncbi:hypothetical protein TNCV_116501 [Trichonephila clavipes]|nr:hypothetical protein TNCV_116501 [Trichonephila clavipes]
MLGIPANRILRLLNEHKMAASTSSRVCSSSMFLMKWNGIMESFLIDEVEKLSYLRNSRHPHFTKRLKKWISADRHEDEQEVAGTQSFLDDISETGVRDLVPKWEHFARLQFLDYTIKPLDSTSNLDYMELEVNVISLNVSDDDLFENVVELPLISYSESQSEQPQGIRVFTSTHPVSTSTPGAKKRKVDSSHEDFYESMQKCLGAVGKKTVNETFAAFIASELDNLPCPKQQVVENYAIHSLSI